MLHCTVLYYYGTLLSDNHPLSSNFAGLQSVVVEAEAGSVLVNSTFQTWDN